MNYLKRLNLIFIITLCVLSGMGNSSRNCAHAQEKPLPSTTVHNKGIHPTEVITKIKQLMPELIKKEEIPGLSIAIISDGKLRWSGGFGTTNTKTGRAVTGNTVFEACSLSKPVFAYGVLKMIDSGKLAMDLNTPLSQYVTDEYIEESFQKGKITDPRLRKITAKMVLTHCPGFPNWRQGKSISIDFEPGEKFSYSGEGFVFLQKVVEKITGRELDDLMQEFVFGPLQMKNSSYLWQERFEQYAANPHSGFGISGSLRKAKNANAAASLYTTAPDYAKFISALLTGEGLSKPMIKQMLTPQIISPYDKNNAIPWGLGVGLQQLNQDISLWHWGDNETFKCFFVAYTKEKNGLVYFTNGFNGLNIVEALVKETFGGNQPLLSCDFFENYNDGEGKLIRIIKTESPETAITLFKEMQKETPFLQGKSPRVVKIIVQFFDEAAQWLQLHQKTANALRLLTFVAEEYPESPEPYIALSNAYERNNNKELALQYSKKAQQLKQKQ